MFNAVQFLYEATDHPKLNPELKKITDPYSGREVYLIPPLKSDVFIMHAQACDEYGNAQVWGGSGQERDKAKAADIVIVQTDQIVGADVIQRDPGKTTIPGLWVDHVVHVPFGAHPTFSSFNYGLDEAHIKMYLAMVKDGRAAEYIDKYVFGPKDHLAYLELVGGLPKMVELQNMLAVES